MQLDKINFATNNYQEAWFVVRTKARAEKKLAADLNRFGWEAVCPTYVTLKQWSDRKKKVEFPLISSVVFVRASDRPIEELYRHHAVVGILREFGKPAIVKNHEIENLLLLAREWNGELIESTSETIYQTGDIVEVVHGNFCGLIGELIACKGKHKIVVNLRALQVQFTIEITKSKVRKLTPKQVA
jgi:transcriptional antiterminator RfaH